MKTKNVDRINRIKRKRLKPRMKDCRAEKVDLDHDML